ncbi:conserved hypothetical protein [Pediculus humanus corporis]|uniref:EGF-like domain-containing protein n=1 Tax=Pediculus humanus subsp. corporis TaxID=121224 RepID=E0VMI6_PEDHC|nr:uncharacterized protein Phum_PHUM310390 [Pediculus humanus corporis]EEB14592.1 conserved hypothetical protein [Pediculus humanus corporis]
MNCHQLNIIIFVWELVNFSGIGSEKTCALNKLFVCPNGESCKQIENSTTLGFCDCKVKYKRITEGGACIKLEDSDHSSLSTSDNINSESSSVSAIAAGVFTTLLLILLTIALVFAAKKYRWIHRIREKAQQYRARHYDTVLVNQEDDPPLA